MDLNFKFSMMAPSRAGKTSIMTAIFSEMKESLSGNEEGIQFWAADKDTKNAIQTCKSNFDATVNSSNGIIKNILGNQDRSISYKFTVSVPSGEERKKCRIDIVDYPGGWLGMEDFAQLCPHLNESQALLVPVPTDILLEWNRSYGREDSEMIRINAAALEMLEVENVVLGIKDWIKRRTAQRKYSILIFVPVKCEAFLNDNGGNVDRSEEIHTALQRLYIDALNITEEQKEYIQIETHAVDTYGIVVLQEVVLKNRGGRDYLESSFALRDPANRTFSRKGALEILAAILKFQLRVDCRKLEMTITNLKKIINSKNIFEQIWDFLTGCDDKDRLKSSIRENTACYRAISEISEKGKVYPARQRIINDIFTER